MYNANATLSFSTEVRSFLVVFCATQILVGSLVNCVVIVTMLISRQLRRRSEDRLILNLAIIDFVAVSIVLPLHIYILNLPYIAMKASYFLVYYTLKALVLAAGCNAILSIAIDRYVAVVHPMRSVVNTRIATVLSWGVAILCTSAMYLCGRFSLYVYMDVLSVAYSSIFMAVTALLYAVIFYWTFKHGKDILNQRRSVGAKPEKFSTHLLMRITMKTFVLMCLFYATYLPATIFVAYFFLFSQREWAEQLGTKMWICSFLLLNSCINPVVYGLRTKRFRNEFRKRIWSRVFHRNEDASRLKPRNNRRVGLTAPVNVVLR